MVKIKIIGGILEELGMRPVDGGVVIGILFLFPHLEEHGMGVGR